MSENHLDRVEEVLKLDEAAAILRVAEDALLNLVQTDAIPAQKISGEWRFLKRALLDWLRYGRYYREFKRYAPPWMFEYPALGEMLDVLEDRLWCRFAENKGPRPGSKEAVLKHSGVFRDDDDLEAQLADARARREAGT